MSDSPTRPRVTPRTVTPFDPSAPNDANLGAVVAAEHGRPWKPFHYVAAQVIGQKRPGDPLGRYAFPIVVIGFPRQCGKTTFLIDLALGRSLAYRDYRCAYTAQTGHKTTENFTTRFTELETGSLAEAVRLRRSAGTERVTTRRVKNRQGGSYLKAFPPKAGALRSDALDFVIVDEAQEHDELLGAALDQTIIPTFSTRPRRQMIVVGTAGTDRSAYFRRYLEKARAGEPGFAVVEYGAPDGIDFLDEETWPLYHPGLAYGLTDEDALRQGLGAMGPAGFVREYGNVWTRAGVRLVDPADWGAVLIAKGTPRPKGRVCLGVSVEADRSAAAIAVAADNGYRELVSAFPGTDWVVPRVLELQKTYGGAIAIDQYGATGTVADALIRALTPNGGKKPPESKLRIMSTLDVANATAELLDGINGAAKRKADGQAAGLAVYPADALTEALEGAVLRPLGDTGGIAFSHMKSSAPVAPLVALAAAGWGFDHLAPEPARPQAHAG